MDYATKSLHGVYQARFQLPSFIVSTHPLIQREFKRSLQTKNRIKAKKILAMMVSSYHVAIGWIEQRMSELSQDEVEAMIKKAIDIGQTMDRQSLRDMGYQTIDSHKADPNFDLNGMLDFFEGVEGKAARMVLEKYFENQKLLRAQQNDLLNSSTDTMLKKMGVEVPHRAAVLELVGSNANQVKSGI
jgi:hypothetical protein